MEYLPIVTLSPSVVALLVSFLSYRDRHRHKRVFDTGIKGSGIKGAE